MLVKSKLFQKHWKTLDGSKRKDLYKDSCKEFTTKICALNNEMVRKTPQANGSCDSALVSKKIFTKQGKREQVGETRNLPTNEKEASVRKETGVRKGSLKKGEEEKKDFPMSESKGSPKKSAGIKKGQVTEDGDGDKGNLSPSGALPIPQVTVTFPVNNESEYGSEEDKGTLSLLGNAEVSNQRQGSGNLTGRRALSDITITCPPIEALDSDAFDEQYFTQRRYMVCRESPRTGKKKTSIIDFPNGLSELEKHDASWGESPRSPIGSPFSFSRLDLTFTYTGPLNSLTPPMSPRPTRNSLYPAPVPVFKLEESFPPAEF